MFTGIIETVAEIVAITEMGTNKSFSLTSPLVKELHPDQSICHNGVCLTVEQVNDNQYTVTAIAETLAKTNLGKWQKGDLVNLERCVPALGRFDGHFVSGHIDTTAICTGIIDKNGSWEYSFSFDKEYANNIIEKGSIALNGISLTIFNVGLNCFTVAIIPYTYVHTNMQNLLVGDTVNLEFDMIGKYVNRIKSLANKIS